MMPPAEWIALVALALSVIVPTLASWRSSIIRDQRIEAKLDALGLRLEQLERAHAEHETDDEHRADRVDQQIEAGREHRHELDLRLPPWKGDPMPTADQTPATASRWTPEIVIGLLCIVASAILPYLDVAEGVATVLATLAAWFLGPLPSPLSGPRGGQRGEVAAPLLVAMLAIGLALVAAALLASGGCALLERREVSCTTPPESVLEDLPDGRCALRGYCDGHELWTAIGPGPCGEIEERAVTP